MSLQWSDRPEKSHLNSLQEATKATGRLNKFQFICDRAVYMILQYICKAGNSNGTDLTRNYWNGLKTKPLR
jgi:hypothetical protein